jgi:hypothetical protein
MEAEVEGVRVAAMEGETEAVAVAGTVGDSVAEMVAVKAVETAAETAVGYGQAWSSEGSQRHVMIECCHQPYVSRCKSKQTMKGFVDKLHHPQTSEIDRVYMQCADLKTAPAHMRAQPYFTHSLRTMARMG